MIQGIGFKGVASGVRLWGHASRNLVVVVVVVVFVCITSVEE